MRFDTSPLADGTASITALHLTAFFPFAAFSRLLTGHIGVILSLAITGILAAQYVKSPWRKVPPGPKGPPILGNALQLKDKRWMFEKDCKQKFRTSDSIFADLLTLQVNPRGWQKILCI